ncbi:M3 family oligoendopeptidase [Poriferisphaera sp. WC338]|uniref:M3 family oligoendopeptidase n=1 Tax=Poriferisphaera sp. WC338 TaxID=3425129 RepID=UPI003D81480B
MSQVAQNRKFVPVDFDTSAWDQVETLCESLLNRETESLEQLTCWLEDYSECQAVIQEYSSRRNIDFACHTDDKEIEAAYLHFIENIAPRLKPYQDKLAKKFLASPHHDQLPFPGIDIMARSWQMDVELFREANIPLQVESAKLNKEYDQLIGQMLVDYQDETYTLQQLAKFLEAPDRSVREETWILSSSRRLEDREKIEGIYESLIELRGKIAANADCENYREYLWKSWNRFDYAPEDCHAFADAVESVCMPLVKKMQQQRCETLGLKKLRPWDLSVDVQNRAPLTPFPADDVSRMVSGCRAIFEKIHPSLAEDYDMLKMGRNLDLDSRKGKRAGGFQASLPESKQPFIFMNAAGLQRDVETMLHEAGHAFHFIWGSRENPIVFTQHAPIEFCEVASMSMELFASPYLDEFYPNKEDADRARRKHLEGIITILPWIATIDQFQHWIYTNPGHTTEQRQAAWLQTSERFQTGLVDYTGYEASFESRWQAQLHLFHVPFYYIEYGIAQLGALGLWAQSTKNTEQALANYRASLALGGTKPLPALFEAAGLRFDFSRETIAPLMQLVEVELDKLPV